MSLENEKKDSIKKLADTELTGAELTSAELADADMEKASGGLMSNTCSFGTGVGHNSIPGGSIRS